MTRPALFTAEAVVGAPRPGNALLVRDGRVVAVGEASRLREAAAIEHPFPGAFLMPGLRDAHLHPVPYAALLGGTSLKSAADLAEVGARLRAAASRSDRPIVALRFDDETVAERRLPTRADLDGAVPDRPVLVHRYCGHVAIANTAALTRARIDARTPDPAGGVIDRDPDGTPNGILRETAIEIVSRALAGSTPVEPETVLSALRAVAGLGITSVGAMLRPGDGPWSSLGDEVELMASIADRLPVRIHAYVIANTTGELDTSREVLDGRSERLRWAGLKRFADGSLGGHTAAMLEPFADAPGERGTLRISSEDERLAQRCLDAGGTVAIHAIGDLACRRVLDLYERLGAPPGRCRVEHASVITPNDVARMAARGVIGCVQPAFLGSESGWLAARVGEARLAMTYPFASMTAAGVQLAAGSDAPVEPPDPWSGMALARDRAGVTPDESLTAEEALALYTAGGAVALGESEPLATGSLADFIVVDRNPVAASPDALRATRVHHVFVGGEEVAVDRAVPTWTD